MLAHVYPVPGMTRRGLCFLSIAGVSGVMACAQPDVTSPASDVPPTGSARSGPVLPALPAWLEPPTWELSDLRRELLFSSESTLHRVASNSAVPQTVMKLPYWPYAVQMSPDGTRTATLHHDKSSQLLCVIDNGAVGTRRCVRTSGARSTSLAWSPDGQALAFGGSTGPGVATSRLSIVDPATLAFRALLPDDGGAASAASATFTPDGNTVSFVLDNRLWRMPLSGGEPQLQPGFEAMGNLYVARWSPDGKSIVLLSWNTDDHTVSVANADGSNLRVLARVPHPSNLVDWHGLDRPAWSPDGEFLGLSLSDCFVEPCAERIVIVSIGGKGGRVLWHQGELHHWR